MNAQAFAKALIPIWALEMLWVTLVHAFGSGNGNWLFDLLGLMVMVALPYWAGIRVFNFGGNKTAAIVGGVTISFATWLVAAIAYSSQNAQPEVWKGALIATVFIAWPLQGVVGAIGWGARRRSSANAT